MWRNAGIIGTGLYVPDFRIHSDSFHFDRASAWNQASATDEHSVANYDEDAVTMAVAAATSALQRTGFDPRQLDAVWVGTESKPYAVKAVATTVAEAIQSTPWLSCVDLEFACRSAIEGLQSLLEQVHSGRFRSALLIAVDAAQARPGDELEHTAGAAAVALIIGPLARSIVQVGRSVSYVTDTPDFFRRDGAEYPRHMHRFTGEPAYFEHSKKAAQMFLNQMELLPSDFRYVIFHQPNKKFPIQMARDLGFCTEQFEDLLLFKHFGNAYAANVPLALARSVELLIPDEMALITAYGSGAGADSFAIRATSLSKPSHTSQFQSYLEHKKLLNINDEYADFASRKRNVR